MKTVRIFSTFLLLFVALSLTSCAPGSDTGHTYSLFSGLAHGFMLPFAIIGKVIGMDHGIYAQNNSGFLYWLGFLLGYLLINGGLVFGGGRRYKRRR